MRILLDPQIFYRQRFGGISRYFTELYRLTRNKPDFDVALPLLYTENQHLTHYGLQPRFLTSWAWRILNKLNGTTTLADRNRQVVIRRLEKGTADLFIPSYFDPYFLKHLKNTPFVLTVYDMIHEIFPQYFPAADLIRANKKLLMEKAARIIAISDNTRRDILKFYPHIDAGKIDVVHLAHSIAASPAPHHPGNYILFVGNREGYKNFRLMIGAIHDWLIKNGFVLYALGGGPFNKSEVTMIDSLGLSNHIVQKQFRDHQLAGYYQQAFAFIFPSQYEGFGIPVLEAMSCSCPVILPAESSFPEVAGDAGVYFDIEAPGSIVMNLERLRTNPAFRFDVISKGRDQAAKFSWEKTVSGCLKVFENALR